MKQGQRLNWKFSIADVDFIGGLAKAGRTAEEIRDRMIEVSVPIRSGHKTVGRRTVPVAVYDIRSICWQSGVKVRAAETV